MKVVIKWSLDVLVSLKRSLTLYYANTSTNFPPLTEDLSGLLYEGLLYSTTDLKRNFSKFHLVHPFPYLHILKL